MGARRGILWAAGGAAAAAAVLTLSPGTYAWLRRLAGHDDDRDHYEDAAAAFDAGADADAVDDGDAGPDEGLRMSLRARLAESAAAEAALADVREENAAASGLEAPLDRPDDGEVASARERMRTRTREARRRIADAGPKAQAAEEA
jgi:hypothetical protein